MAGSEQRPGEGNDRSIARSERAAVQRALDATGKARAILDVASGNGRWAESLTRSNGAALVHFDLSAESLSAARGAHQKPNHGFVRGDAGALPFRPQVFDLVVCLEFLPYISRSGGRVRALKEMRRVSRRWVVVQYSHRQGLRFAWQRLRARLGMEAKFPRSHLSYDQIDDELRLAGLGLRHVFRIGGPNSRSCVVVAEAPSPDWMKSS